MIRVAYKEIRWRWWVRPLVALAVWSHSERASRLVWDISVARGRYVVMRP